MPLSQQASMQNPSCQSWRILLITCRDPATDFRLPLAQELQALGHQVAYAFLKHKPVVTELAAPSESLTLSLPGFFHFMKSEAEKCSRILIFNSTNLVFPLISRILRKICGGLWCFDMHDDLLYGRSGFARTRAALAQHLLLGGSDFVVHAAPTLKELFPTSHHLGNASSITIIPRVSVDYERILILASLDARFDFDFLSAAAAANPGLRFHIHGLISQNDRAIAQRIETAIRHHANLIYHGPYVNEDLPKILVEYSVTLAPYVTQSSLTRYIDPLRYYHCLNSGMEVISTDIPKARDFEDVLHLVHAPNEIGPLVARFGNEAAARRNRGSTALIHNWRNRAIALLDLAAVVYDTQTRDIMDDHAYSRKSF